MFGRILLIASVPALLTLSLFAAEPEAKPVAKEPAPSATAPTPTPAAKLGNLIINGNFEAGTATPEGWQSVDGLSSFWVDDPDPAHGKVLRFNTDVLQSQAYPWWKQIAAGAVAKDAPLRLPTVEPKYDTLAGLDGVWFWSDPIPVEKGKAYWLTVDGKGPGPVEVWLHGYPEKPSTRFGADAAAFQGYLLKEAGQAPNVRGRKAFIHTYVWKGRVTLSLSNEWKTHSRREKPFRPTAVTPTVKWVRIQLFPYWPPGDYYIDNVSLVEVDAATDAAQADQERIVKEERAKKVKAIRDAAEKAEKDERDK